MLQADHALHTDVAMDEQKVVKPDSSHPNVSIACNWEAAFGGSTKDVHHNAPLGLLRRSEIIGNPTCRRTSHLLLSDFVAQKEEECMAANVRSAHIRTAEV